MSQEQKANDDQGIEQLRAVAARLKPWSELSFCDDGKLTDMSATNSLREDAANWSVDGDHTKGQGPGVYGDVVDFTEGIAAFYVMAPLMKSDGVKLIADIGGGSDDQISVWAKEHIGADRIVFDPFAIPRKQNEEAVQKLRGGKADAAVSSGPLNIIESLEGRLAHILTMKDSVKVGGKCYFNVWAGMPGQRGTGVAFRENWKEDDAEVKSGKQKAGTEKRFQWNKFASAFLPEVVAVFGSGNATVHRDDTQIIAVRKD